MAFVNRGFVKRSRAVTSALTFNLCITICDFWLLSYSVLAITLIFIDYFLKKLPLKKINNPKQRVKGWFHNYSQQRTGSSQPLCV